MGAQGLVLASVLGLTAVSILSLKDHWAELRFEVGAGLLWMVLMGAWGLGIMILYREAPIPFWLGMGLQMWAQAALAAVIWPAAVRWSRLAGTPAVGALWSPRAPAVMLGAVATAVLAGLLTWSMVPLFEQSVSPQMKQVERWAMLSGPGFMLIGVGAAVGEELIFRLGFFAGLSRLFRGADRRGLLAAVISSALWTLMHGAHTEPASIKYLQIFPFGLALCALYRLGGGIEGPILAHALFNGSVIVLGWPA